MTKEETAVLAETRELAKSGYAKFITARSTPVLMAIAVADATLYALLSVDGVGIALGLVGDDVIQAALVFGGIPILRELNRRFHSATSS